MKRFVWFFVIAILSAMLFSACAPVSENDITVPIQEGAEQTIAPVPSSMPEETEKPSIEPQPTKAPVQIVSETEKPTEQPLVCTVSVTCKTALSNQDRLNPSVKEILPADGVIFAPCEVAFTQGESVYDVLLRITREYAIHMESTTTPVYDARYIEGIANLYEFDCGELSGWMYRVNGIFPGYGCSKYLVCPGDAIEWLYTCDLGRDIGGEGVTQK